MTKKEEKYLAVGRKIANANNWHATDCYFGSTLENTNEESLDLYTPIFYKYNKQRMENLIPFRMTVCILRDLEDKRDLCDMPEEELKYALAIEYPKEERYEPLPIDDVSEEMLDEMLAVKDVGRIVTALMKEKSIMMEYEDYKARQLAETRNENKVSEDIDRITSNAKFSLNLALISLATSIILLITNIIIALS